MTLHAICSIVNVDTPSNEDKYNVVLSIQATDGTNYANGSVLIQLNTGLLEVAFNSEVINGIKDWVDSQYSGWNISKTRIFAPMWHRGVI